MSSIMCCATCKEVPGVAGSHFDRVWGTRWWRDVDGRTESKGWVVRVGEDGDVLIYYLLISNLGIIDNFR